MRAELEAPGAAVPLQGRGHADLRAAVQLVVGVIVAGIEIEEAGGKGEAVPQRLPRRSLEAVDGGPGDVVVDVEAARPHLAEQAVVDQVLDIVVEQGGGVGAALPPPVHAQLVGTAGFRLDVRVAVEGVRPFGADVVRRDLLQGRRAERLAVAGLEGQVRGSPPDQVGARTGLRTEHLVAVEPRAEGQRPVFGQRHLVLQVDGLVDGFVRSTHQAGVLQFLFAIFAAEGDEVPLAQGEGQAAIGDIVAQRLRPGGSDAHAAPVGDIELRARIAQLRTHLAPLPRVAEGFLAAVDVVLVAELRGAPQIVAPAFLVAAQQVEGQVVPFRQLVAQRQAAGLPRLALDFREAVVFLQRRGAPAQVLRAQFQAQAAAQRAARHRRQHMTIARAGIAAQRTIAVPLRRGLAGDDVDHAAHGLGAIECRHGAADQLDALHLVHRHPAVLVIRMADHVVGGGNPPAIDQHQGVAILHAADGDVLPPADLAPGQGDARQAAQGFQQVGRTLGLDFLGADHGHRRWRIGHGMFGLAGGDGGRIELEGIGRAGTEGRHGGKDSGQGQLAHIQLQQDGLLAAGLGRGPGWLKGIHAGWFQPVEKVAAQNKRINLNRK
ncbi:hypothetical protein D9M71_245690 [compost metagenome]